jgi:hypothetical protein
MLYIVRQRGSPTSTNPQISDRKKSDRKSQMGAWYQYRLTVGRNITLALTVQLVQLSEVVGELVS